MDCSPPGSSVLGISQARILEWFAISFSRGSSPLRDWPQVSCIAGGFFYCWAIRVYTQNQLYTRKIVSVNFVEHDNSHLFSSLNFYQNSEVYTISCICLKREIGIKFTYFVYSQSKREKKKTNSFTKSWNKHICFDVRIVLIVDQHETNFACDFCVLSAPV